MTKLKIAGTAGYTMGFVAKWIAVADAQGKIVAYVKTEYSGPWAGLRDASKPRHPFPCAPPVVPVARGQGRCV